MNINDVQACFRREHWTSDSGITAVGIGSDDDGKPCLVVRVLDESSKAKIVTPYNGVTVTVTVEGAPVPT